MFVMRFKTGLAVAAGALPASLVLIILFLTIYAWPAILFNGFQFVTSNTWNLGNLYSDPVMVNGVQISPGAHYGSLFLLVGTLLSTIIALLIAVPVGVGAAVFLAEAVPGRLRLALSFFVELLAAVPSVVFGLWGYVVVIPFLGHYLFPFMISVLGFLPFFGGPPGSGYGLLTSGVVLSLMIVPLIVATLRDALVSQPAEAREAVTALGATKFEVVWKVLLPSQSRVLIGASILALGRALGETMAVLMVSGNALNYLPGNIYTPISTMAAFIVSQLDSALQDPTDMAVKSLAEIALILSLISLIINFLARILLSFEKQGARRATFA
jgi:phosphate transport system permease protein